MAQSWVKARYIYPFCEAPSPFISTVEKSSELPSDRDGLANNSSIPGASAGGLWVLCTTQVCRGNKTHLENLAPVLVFFLHVGKLLVTCFAVLANLFLPDLGKLKIQFIVLAVPLHFILFLYASSVTGDNTWTPKVDARSCWRDLWWIKVLQQGNSIRIQIPEASVDQYSVPHQPDSCQCS